jgi:hypothetical protein
VSASALAVLRLIARFGWLRYWQVRRFLTLQNLVDVHGRLTPIADQARTIVDQFSELREAILCSNNRQSIFQSRLDHKKTRGYQHVDCINLQSRAQPTCLQFRCLTAGVHSSTFDVFGTLNGHRGNAETARRQLGFTQQRGMIRSLSAPQYRHSHQTGNDFPKQLQSLGRHLRSENAYSGKVATSP